MERFVRLDSTGRIEFSADGDGNHGENGFLFPFPEDFDFDRQNDYRIIAGKLVHDPLPEEEAPPDPRDVMIAELLRRAAEQDLALVELAAMIAGGGA